VADLAIGIMSGTSADGVDAALIAASGGDPPKIDAIAHLEVPFDADLRKRILAAGAGDPLSAHDLARLNAELGDLYAEAALRLMRDAPGQPVVIGLHGGAPRGREHRRDRERDAAPGRRARSRDRLRYRSREHGP